MPLALLQVAYAVEPSASFATIPAGPLLHPFCRNPPTSVPCVCPTIQTPLLSLRGQCKLILSCIKRRETRFVFPPPPPPQLLTASTQLCPLHRSKCVYRYFTYLYLTRTHFLASNDIYAILIGYFLYMQPHTRELSLPLPVLSTSSCL